MTDPIYNTGDDSLQPPLWMNLDTDAQPVSPGDHSVETGELINHHHNADFKLVPGKDPLNSTEFYLQNSKAGVDKQWYLFYSKYYPLDLSVYNKNPDYYHQLFSLYWKEWFEKLPVEDRNAYLEIANATPPLTSAQELKITELFNSWDIFLSESDIVLRERSPFLWIYNLLIEYTLQAQATIFNEGNRLLVLQNVQEEVTKALSAAVAALTFVGDTTPNNPQKASNLRYNKNIEVYNSKSVRASDLSNATSNAVDNVSNYLTQAQSIQSSLISQLQDMITSIFS